MSPDLQRLIDLQRLETTLGDARGRIAAHPQRLAEADARLAAATQALDAVKQRLKDNQDARREAEKNVALYQGRLAKFKDQQGAVKNNREYQALGHEIETATHELGSVEEKVLERMMEADAIAAEIKTAEAAFAAEKKEIDAERKALVDELATLEHTLTDATAARATVVKELDPRLVATFEQVAKIRKGIAVTTATRDGLCAVCHVRLRPQVFQLVRQNDAIIQCDHCHRILYYVPPPPPIEHAVTHRP
jgi:predicted  nucleic acid-binding Zn-ribbon protein